MSATITKEAGIESISMSMSLSISGRIEDMEKGLKHLDDSLANYKYPSGVITRVENLKVSMSISISGRIEDDVEKGLKHLEDSLANYPSGVINRVANPKTTYHTKDEGLRDAARNGRLEDVKKYLNDGAVNVDGKDQN